MVEPLPKLVGRLVDVRSPAEQQKLLWGQVLEGTGHPHVREHVARLVQRYKIPPRDPLALARAALDHAQTEITYMREHPDTFVHPARTLEWKIGDCDDIASLLAATMRTAKIPARLVFGGWAPKGSARVPFKHVWAETWIEPLKRWVALEGVRRVPAGWSVLPLRLSQGMRIRKATYGDTPEKMQ